MEQAGTASSHRAHSVFPDMSFPESGHYSNTYMFFSFLYRDNGVTIQISKYQFFTELGAFITMMIIGVYNDSLIFKDTNR